MIKSCSYKYSLRYYFHFNFKPFIFLNFHRKMKLTIFMTIFCCAVGTRTVDVVCSLEKCDTVFDKCVHSSPSIMNLIHFKECVNKKSNCKAACSYRKKRALSFVAMDTSRVTLTKKTNPRHECIQKCKQQFKGCDQKTFDGKFLCLRNFRRKCRDKCAVKEKLFAKITSAFRGFLLPK